MNTDFLETPELLELAQRLTLARIKAMPDTLTISVGTDQFGKRELIGHVEDADTVGKNVMELQIEFLRDLANGAIYEYA